MAAEAIATVSTVETVPLEAEQTSLRLPLEVEKAEASVAAATVSGALEVLAELEEQASKRPPHRIANQTACCASGSQPVRVLVAASSELTQS